MSRTYDFAGYLIADGNTVSISGNDISGTITPFPLEYMIEDSYETLPDSREEIKAVRDDYTRDLTRVTAPGTKTSISFTLIAPDLMKKKAIQKWFTDRESDKLQRKIKLLYWNDDENKYKISNFYRTDLKFKIKKVTKNNIYYDSLEIKLVEY